MNYEQGNVKREGRKLEKRSEKESHRGTQQYPPMRKDFQEAEDNMDVVMSDKSYSGCKDLVLIPDKVFDFQGSKEDQSKSILRLAKFFEVQIGEIDSSIVLLKNNIRSLQNTALFYSRVSYDIHCYLIELLAKANLHNDIPELKAASKRILSKLKVN